MNKTVLTEWQKNGTKHDDMHANTHTHTFVCRKSQTHLWNGRMSHGTIV